MFAWRKLYGEMSVAAPGSQPVPVVMTSDQPVEGPTQVSSDVIEVELPRGCCIRVGSTVKAATLRLVLDALVRR